MRPDDSSVDDGTLGEIREHVDRALRDSGALGVFPTPIERIVQSAKLSIASDVSLDAGFFAKIYRSGADTIRKAVSKVLGLLDVGARYTFPFAYRPMPFDERCKGWTKRENA